MMENIHRRNYMKKLLLCCFSIALLFLAAGHANAVTITQTSTFSVTSSEGNAAPSFVASYIGITPFNPSLGTLNEVRVSITGQTHVDFYAEGISVLLTPYPTPIIINNSFIGVGGKYFAFDSPAGYGWVATAGGDWNLDNDFAYHFVFNDVTDLTGSTLPTITNTVTTYGNPSISGHLADFAAFPIDSITFVEISQFFVVTQMSSAVSTNGGMTVEYDYTPDSTPSVPEPSTMLLLGGGLIGLAGLRKRFFKK
jgi:hypothetical protein